MTILITQLKSLLSRIPLPHKHIVAAKAVKKPAKEATHGIANAFLFEHLLPEHMSAIGTLVYEAASAIAVATVVIFYIIELRKGVGE